MNKVVFFGTPDYVICVPEKLKRAGYKILAVVTQPPKPVGRKKIITPSPVSEWAAKNNVPIITEHLQNNLKKLNADFAVLASYGKIIDKDIIDIFPRGIINLHPSLLPNYRGACPVQEQILDGGSKLGLSIMLMDEKMDHGPILVQSEIPIFEGDTQQSMLFKAFEKSSDLLIKILPKYFMGNVNSKIQDESLATYTYKTSESKNKAYFDIYNPPPVEVLNRMIRAFYPWPIVWTNWKGKVIKLYPNKKVKIEGKNITDSEEFKKIYPDFPLRI